MIDILKKTHRPPQDALYDHHRNRRLRPLPLYFAKKGGLINLRPDDLAAQVLKGLVNKLDLDPSLMSSFPQVYMAMGHTAEEVAKRYAIGREEQEAMAVESHAKAVRARELGYFKDEILAVAAKAKGGASC